MSSVSRLRSLLVLAGLAMVTTPMALAQSQATPPDAPRDTKPDAGQQPQTLAPTAQGTPAAPSAQASTGASSASAGAPTPSTTVEFRSTGIPQRDTMLRMMQTVETPFVDVRLEDFINYVALASGAPMEVFWTDGLGDGLDKDVTITVRPNNFTLLRTLEIALDRAHAAQGGTGDGNQWQISEDGILQIGTKERLNRFTRLEIYPIQDLILETPDFPGGPELDIQQALQTSGGRGGGGGGQNPFTDDEEEDAEQRSEEERANEIIDIITTNVEPDQWRLAGGEAGTIRYYRGNLLVTAPDYMHRQINGYPWWPATSTRVGQVQGRRYVTLTADTALSTLVDLRTVPITAVTGGGGAGDGSGGGGGGAAPPGRGPGGG